MSDELKGVWSVLREIKEDLKRFDDKWETHIQSASEDRAHLKSLCVQVANIEQLLTRGNGQKSVLVQLERLHTDVESLKNTRDVSTAPTVEDIRKARWVAIAKIIGLVAIALPGILALFSSAP